MKIKIIESPSNPVYRKLLTLAKSRGIEKEQECLIGGEKIIAEILRDKTIPLNDAYWVYHSDDHALFSQPGSPDTLVQLPKPLFTEVDIVGVHSPLLCTTLPSLKEWDSAVAVETVEILCALGDPNNLGALMRSAEAFGVSSIVLLEECCHPFHPKVIKSSAGSCFRLQLSHGPSIKSLNDVKDIFALDAGGLPLKDIRFPKNPRILLGEEGLGIPENLKLQKVSIPISSKVESLNATVAASILFYELSKKV